jgi:hypothetical protein
VDLVHLIKLVVPGEEREKGEDLEEDASNAPVVHLVVVVPISQEALRRPIPPSGDVLRKRRL